ncbi:hypothetical protein TPY_0510 [Sulfobacillus acidophilus TPY]|nr:hypothetical protein TPY_0510 [Sulfobacillus acidophilus TPY]
MAQQMVAAGTMTHTEVAWALNISRSTLYRALRRVREK